MKRIGMMVAVEIEAVLSKYGQPERCEECCGFEVMKNDCNGYELLIVKSGEGEIAAAAATQQISNLVDFFILSPHNLTY